ncbi:MAG: methyltransferase domain-containing protein [Thermogemmatispora sp.]|uniref:class I SAM-dependent methyltransferase n=2 Tax=Thermogemmatispora sp. TaxID=1968838 RepID=UPI001DF52CB2|nr:class I SAM-dependent methyltransferase [Thermogemmatispora sp.]MBX5452249.1 methyltransferase domain-containing protein [Thermogemmatispora sp.]
MVASQNHIVKDCGYVLDAENAAETARLMLRDRLVNEAMGGVLPEGVEGRQLGRVLDLACGPGGWVLETAQRYPWAQVTGIDISETLIQYARAQAQVQGLSNARFEVMDLLEPLPLPSNTFDLVNARDLTGLLTPSTWPRVLREALRVCRPGGLLRLTEFERPVSNGAAFMQLQELTRQAFQRTGRSFPPSSHHLGVLPRLTSLLREAGCCQVQQRAYVLDFSSGSEAHEALCRGYEVELLLSRPFLLDAGVTTAAEFDALYRRALLEMLDEHFAGLCYILTAWGKKASAGTEL